jgi:hypothetical protein
MPTVTATLNGALPSVALACGVTLMGILLYRIVRIVVSMTVDALLSVGHRAGAGAGGKLKPLARFAQLGLVGYAVQFLTLLCMAGLRLAIAAFNVGLAVAYAMLPLLVLSCVLALMHERWNESMAVLLGAFNGPLSTVLRAALLTPITILDTIGTHALPAWNLLIYVLKMPLELLYWLLHGDGVLHLMQAFRALGAAVPLLAQSGGAFIEANGGGACPSSYCDNSSSSGTAACLRLQGDVVAQACFDPARHEMDFMPAFAHVQQAAAHALLSLGASCDTLALLLNVTLFPLTDPTLWLAVDRGLNAVLSALVVAPLTAAKRCSMVPGGFVARPAMCTPDLGPAWGLAAVAGLRLGDALTHWSDGLYLALFEETTIQEACAASTNDGATYGGLWEDPTARLLFGANATALVRLTPTALALTDGRSVVYVYESPFLIAYAPNAWPFPIDPRHGVARAWLPSASGADASEGGVGLFGCACDAHPEAGGVQLRCASVSRSGTVRIVPVDFSLGAQAQLLTCDRVRLSVQSVRWPRRRAAVVHLGAAATPPRCDADEDGSCLAADVAVWLIPVCGAQDGVQALACLPERRFTRGICFPYCMALRLQHEGFGRPLAMRGASEWTDGVLMTGRDCVPSASAASAAATTTAAAAAGDNSVRSVCTIAADAAGQTLPQTAAAPADAARCVWSATCTTMFANKSALGAYAPSSTVPAFANTASGGVRLVLDGQPLVVGGATLMRQFIPIGSNDYYFDFPTLVGNTLNEFTLEPYSAVGVPATRVLPNTPSKQVS